MNDDKPVLHKQVIPGSNLHPMSIKWEGKGRRKRN